MTVEKNISIARHFYGSPKAEPSFAAESQERERERKKPKNIQKELLIEQLRIKENKAHHPGSNLNTCTPTENGGLNNGTRTERHYWLVFKMEWIYLH